MPIIKTEKRRKSKDFFPFPYCGVVINVKRPHAIELSKGKDIKIFCFSLLPFLPLSPLTNPQILNFAIVSNNRSISYMHWYINPLIISPDRI